MPTQLHGPLRREIRISGEPHVLTIDPHGLKLTHKGRRKGLELSWKDLTSGEAALATALNASLGLLQQGPARRTARSTATSSRKRTRPRSSAGTTRSASH